jgi:hypothetical protein
MTTKNHPPPITANEFWEFRQGVRLIVADPK